MKIGTHTMQKIKLAIECLIVKHEHAAGLLLSDKDFKVPDYRLILKDGTQFLVEVKNCNKLKKSFKVGWLAKQKEYAALNKPSLKLAVYWRQIGEWTLVDASIFKEKSKGCYTLEVSEAIMRNEMATLGDITLGTLLPLKLQINFSRAHTQLKDNESWETLVESIEMFCGNTRIRDDLEKSIAFKVMVGGNLKEDAQIIFGENELPIANLFTYDKFVTNERNNEEFEMVGALSRIISSSYMHATGWSSDNTEKELIMPRQEPEDFKIFIPENYIGRDLPLWRFVLKPNIQALS
ncbi:MAG: hypothetical protein MK052_03950 [Alphaproteobacteria bacterium]|nr:hypothetical protein [Alphaproteobacteria bacterium]